MIGIENWGSFQDTAVITLSLPCSSNDRLLMCGLYDNTGKCHIYMYTQLLKRDYIPNRLLIMLSCVKVDLSL